MDDHYLELSEKPIRFDAISALTNVFFDDSNGQVFSVRSSGVTGVIVQGPDQNASTTFRMEDKGQVISIKFSPDLSILAIQRLHSSVDFINFVNLIPNGSEYSQPCKPKNGNILGFYWIKANEIAFITDHGIELLQVLPEKRQLKSLKTIKIAPCWFSWCAPSKLVILATSNGLFLNPFTFNNSSIIKLPRVEIEGPVTDSDVNCARLYNVTWCLILRHGGKCPAEVLVIPLDNPNSSEVHSLRTGLIGRFAINVVDDLVVVHHKASKTSMLFDIMEDSSVEGDLKIHIPISPPKSLKTISLPNTPCQMYSTNWAVFQPDIIIDVRLGCLWRVILKPSGIKNVSLDKTVGILLRRSNGRTPIFSILKHMISNATNYLIDLMKVFDKINAVYRKQADLDMVKQTGQNSNHTENFANSQEQSVNYRVIITQQDVYTNVLQHYTDSPHIIQVVQIYICSLARYQVSPQHALTEMLVRALVRANRYSELHQLLQYGAVGDSKPLACLLLSLANLHPAAHQLALDMLHRLNAYEETVEVLLGEGEIISGVSVAKQYSAGCYHSNGQAQSGNMDVWNSLRARKLLSLAQSNVNTFVSVYHALQQRNRNYRNSSAFIKGEQCDTFVQLYSTLFPDEVD